MRTGCNTNACICIGTHCQPFLQTDRWIFMKFVRDELLMVPYKCCCFSARYAQGRIQTGAKIFTGVPFFKELLQTGKLQQQT